MNYPFIKYRPDYCVLCDSQRSIECYDIYGKPINYVILVDKYNRNKELALDILHNKNLSCMKCKRCHNEFRIDWSSPDRFPKPLYSDKFKLNLFINRYSKDR